eukprot:gene10261-2680_t
MGSNMNEDKRNSARSLDFFGILSKLRGHSSPTSSGNSSESSGLLEKNSYEFEMDKDQIYHQIELQRPVNWEKVLELCEKQMMFEDDLLIQVWKFEASCVLGRTCSLPAEIFMINESDDSDDIFALGKAYFLLEDYINACKWFRISAERNNVLGEMNYAFMLEKGLGCDQNVEKAMDLYFKSAGKGYFKAQYNLGCIFEEGKKFDRNRERAFEFYMQAAQQGFAFAQSKVAWFYKHRIPVDVPKNFNFEKEAKNWWTKSADQGYDIAEEYLALFY